MSLHMKPFISEPSILKLIGPKQNSTGPTTKSRGCSCLWPVPAAGSTTQRRHPQVLQATLSLHPSFSITRCQHQRLLHTAMGIRYLHKTLRNFSIPHSQPLFKTPPSNSPLSNLSIHFGHFHSSDSSNSSFSSTGCSPVCPSKCPFANCSPSLQTSIFFGIHGRICYIDDGHSCLKLHLHTPCTRRHFTSYPYSFYRDKPYATSKQVSEIIALIREDANDLGSKLSVMNVALSMASTVEILESLARERVPVLRFFDWLKASHPDLCCDPQIGSLVINNCGLLGNYAAMVPILNKLNLKRIHLGRKAFAFLVVLSSDKASTVECVRKMVDVLNEVGGSCGSSGFRLLIELFSVSGSFDIAEFMIGRARRKVSHYNILLRAVCRRGDYERAGDLLKEMKRSGCDPNRTAYNLLISCLCRNGKFAEACQMLETMEKEYGLPDASTFDILINLLCKHLQFDLVLKYLDKMIFKGIEPCISTHAAIIKYYFGSGKYEEAHEYVLDSAVKQRYSSNANYSLLATLHLRKGNLILARKILFEMMDKGLKPNFPVYMKIRKCLQKRNENYFSSELLRRYSSLIEK